MLGLNLASHGVPGKCSAAEPCSQTVHICRCCEGVGSCFWPYLLICFDEPFRIRENMTTFSDFISLLILNASLFSSECSKFNIIELTVLTADRLMLFSNWTQWSCLLLSAFKPRHWGGSMSSPRSLCSAFPSLSQPFAEESKNFLTHFFLLSQKTTLCQS